jgi:hypothetical protein
MTPEDLRTIAEMGEGFAHPHKGLIKEIVHVMMTLRKINVEAIDQMLDMHRRALAFMPDQLKPAFEVMITDFVLIKAFIEQAKAYDKTEEGEKAFEAVFGEIKLEKGGDK